MSAEYLRPPAELSWVECKEDDNRRARLAMWDILLRGVLVFRIRSSRFGKAVLSRPAVRNRWPTVAPIGVDDKFTGV